MAANLQPNPPRMDEIIDNEGWESFIETLLTGLNFDYELEITKDKVNIKADANNIKAIQARLEKAFESPDIFIQYFSIKALDHEGKERKITPAKQAAEGMAIPQAPALEDSVKEGVARFKRLFGNLHSIGGVTLNVDELFNESQGARSQNGVLYSKPVKGNRQAKAWKAFLEVLLPRFINVSVNDLKKIWLDENTHLPEAPESYDDEILEGTVQRFFKTITENGETRLVFDYAGLQKEIFPPKFPIPIQEDDKSTKDGKPSERAVISLSKPELQKKTQDIAHQIANEEEASFLIRVYKKGGKPKANVLFFTSEKGPKKIQRIHFVIDCSGSMGSLINKLKKDILDMISQLRTLDKSIEVQITLFSHRALPSRILKITEVAEIERFVLQYHSGTTSLYETIEDTLVNIKKEALSEPNVDHTVIATTDGFDDHGFNGFEAFKQRITQLNSANHVKKFFPIGIGSGHDRDTMKLMGVLFNTPYIYQEKPSDFDQIYNYARQIRHAEKVFSVKMKGAVSGNEKQYRIPVTLDGNPKEALVEFPFIEKEEVVVEINGKTFSFKIEDAAKLPEATVRDVANEFLNTARSVVAGGGTAIKKAENLKTISSQLADLKTKAKLTQAHRTLIDKGQEKIKLYVDRLQEAASKNDESIHEGLKSAAKDELGFTEEAVQKVAKVAIEATPSTPTMASSSPSFLIPGVGADVPPPLPFENEYIVLEGIGEIEDGRETNAGIKADANINTMGNSKSKASADNSEPAKEKKASTAKAEKPSIPSVDSNPQMAAKSTTIPVMHQNGVGDSVPAFMHTSPTGSTLIFSSKTAGPQAPAALPYTRQATNTGSQGINVMLNSCKPVQFDGKPSLACKAQMPNNQTVDMIDTPTLPKAPIDLSGTIMLAFTVCGSWLKSIMNNGLTQKGFNTHFQLLNACLQEITEIVNTLACNSSDDAMKLASYNIAITDFREDLKRIGKKGYKDAEAREAIMNLKEYLSSLVEEVKAFKSEQVRAIRENPALNRTLTKAWAKRVAELEQLERCEQNQMAALETPTAVPMISQFLQQPSANYAALTGANTVANINQALPQTVQPISVAALPSVRVFKG